MKKIFNIILFLFSFFMFSNSVYANSYAISLKSNVVSDTLKNGDIIEIFAGIACVSETASIDYHKFTLLFDDNIFEVLNYDDDSAYKLRDGWKFKSSGFRPGQYDVEMESTSFEHNISGYEELGNCYDSVDSVLVSFKLKVKNVKNQSTKIQLINHISYVEELNFSIYNKSSNTYLSSLGVENYILDTQFNKNNFDYEVYVPYDTDKINIVATAEDNKANISGIGEKNLDEGDNKFDLLVTAEDGTKKNYSINVIRKKANDDTSLSKILLTDSKKEKIELTYDEKTKTYTGNVSYDITFVSFDIVCSGEGCYVDNLGPESLSEGENKFSFTVVSQNGDKENYEIVINKDFNKKINKEDNLVLFLSIGLGLSIILSIVLLVLYIRKIKK